MIKIADAEFSELLTRVSAWPEPERAEFARRVLDTIEALPAPTEATQLSPSQVIDELRSRYPAVVQQASIDELRAQLQPLIGLAAGGKPPPSDAQVRGWIEAHRRAKFAS